MKWLSLLLALAMLAPGLALGEADTAPALTHYLLLGFDFWGDETIGVSYSDTNMLATIDRTNGRLMITSLLRDTYVEKPDGTWGRLNNIVRDEGFDVMLGTVSQNYGVTVDKYMAIGVKGLRRLIDAIGGVEITLTSTEAEKLAEVSGVRGKGTQRLGAPGVMAYIRLRKTDGDEFGRTERQRKVLAQVFSQVQAMSLTEMMGLAQQLLNEIETNMTLADVMDAVSAVYEYRGGTLEMMRLPIGGGYENATRHGMMVYELDWEANRAALEAFLYEGITPENEED